MNTKFVTPAQITHIAQQVASICRATGLAFTMTQLEDCALALLKLNQASPSEKQAQALFAQLVMDISQREECWDRLTQELYFEVNVLLQGDRATAALRALQEEPNLNDEALDRYQDRLQRWAPTG